MEDTVHVELQGVVVAIDGFGVARSARGAKWLGGGEQGFDGLVAENDERGDRPETAGEGFVAAGVADAANDVLAVKLFPIASSVARTVLCVALITEGAHPSGEIGGSEAVG